MVDLHPTDRASRVLALGLGASLILQVPAAPALATPLATIQETAETLSSDEQQALDEFKKFIDGGLKRWEKGHDMKVPAGLSLLNRDGQLKNNQVVVYVTWMHDRNPAHFDARHPKLGHLIEQTEARKVAMASGVQAASATVATSSTTGTTSAATGSTSSNGSVAAPIVGAEFLTQTVPEPSSLATALLLLAASACWRRLSSPK